MEATRVSYETVVGHAAELQDKNARLAQDAVGSLSREYRRQTEVSRAVAWELVERAEEHRNALRTVARESVDPYVDLLYAPLRFYREGLELVGGAPRRE